MALKPNNSYLVILHDLKEKIRQARQRASFSVNKELLAIYWQIGKVILEQKQQESWGSKFVNQLAADLNLSFPT